MNPKNPNSDNMSTPKLRFKEFKEKWGNAFLGEVFEITAGGDIDLSHVSETKDEKFKYPIYANAEKSKGFYGYSDLYKVKAGAITVAGRGVNMGIAHARDHEFYPIVRLLVLLPKKEVNILFFEYGINRLNLFVESTGVPQLTVPQISKYKIAFPSLPEQQKIASFLSTVDEKIQQLTRKKELLEQYKKGVMQQLFSGKLRFKAPNGKPYPKWEEKRLGEISEKVTEKNKGTRLNFVLTNSATQGVVSQSEYFDRDIANQNNLEGYFIVKVDDFVYNPRVSVSAPVGPIKRNKLAEGVMSPLYLVFRFQKQNLEYLEYFFATSLWYEYLESVANIGARHDRMNISNADFFNMLIPYPCDEEQQKIASFLSAIDAKIEGVANQITKAQTFKKGLLQQMFV